MSESPVSVEVDGQILIVTLDRPKANAVDAPTSRALYDAFVQLRDDPNLRVGIITGGGEKFFCAGWDLKAATEGESSGADADRFQPERKSRRHRHWQNPE